MTALLIQACAVTPVGPSCETFKGEALVSCKAEEKCKSKKSNYTVSLGTPNAANLGMSTAPTPTTVSYKSCIEGELNEQRSNDLITDKDNPQH